MKKRVLVITGSPRKGGNSDMMAEAFIKGLPEAYEVERFDAGRKKIGGCRACNTCYTKGMACSFDDDFNELAPMLERADMVVFASPIYFYGFTAQIKAAMDKFYSLYIGKRPITVKEGVLLTCGETDAPSDFEGIIRNYELALQFMQWKDRGHLVVTDANAKGDILKTDGLQRAEDMARTM